MSYKVAMMGLVDWKVSSQRVGKGGNRQQKSEGIWSLSFAFEPLGKIVTGATVKARKVVAKLGGRQCPSRPKAGSGFIIFGGG